MKKLFFSLLVCIPFLLDAQVQTYYQDTTVTSGGGGGTCEDESTPACSIDNAMVYGYRFEDNLTAESGASGSYVSFNGTPTYTACNTGAGGFGRAWDSQPCSGSETWMYVGDNVLASPVTISVWFKTSNSGGIIASTDDTNPNCNSTIPNEYANILYVGSNGRLASGIWHSGGRRMIYSDDPNTGGLDYRDNQWHHVVLILGNGATTFAMYVDGVFTSSRSTPNWSDVGNGDHFTLNGCASNGWPLNPGCTTWQAEDHLIDDFFVFAGELTLTEIECLYNNPNNINFP